LESHKEHKLKTYGISDTHKGPWLGADTTPSNALARGRAMWGNKRVYVAEIQPIDYGEGLPSIAVLVGDVRETLVEKYGSGADIIFDDNKAMIALEVWWQIIIDYGFVDVIEQQAEAEDFMTATKIKSYTALQTVKVGDFK
jgi:hypothetical protein